jgi:hypothetical protein
LVGNLLSPVANLLLLYWMAACGLTLTGLAGTGLAHPLSHAPDWLQPILAFSAAISAIGTGVRVHLSARIYGMRFAAAAPLRAFWGNLINCCATTQALNQFVTARIRRRSLTWRKTDHVYPRLPALIRQRPRLGEVLVHLHLISTEDLEHALLHKPKGQRIGEYLVGLNKITVIDLDQALSSQAGTVGVWVPEPIRDLRDLPQAQHSPSPGLPA